MSENVLPHVMPEFLKKMIGNNRVLLSGNYGGTLRPFSFQSAVLGNQAEILISLKEQYKSSSGNDRKKINKKILDCIQAIEDWAEPRKSTGGKTK